MAGLAVAYIASEFKMAAAKESFLAQRVYEQIREQIQTGKLSPGTRLVNRKMAIELGTSMVPVREALNRLTSEGLLEHLPGGGNFVRKLNRKDPEPKLNLLGEAGLPVAPFEAELSF